MFNTLPPGVPLSKSVAMVEGPLSWQSALPPPPAYGLWGPQFQPAQALGSQPCSQITEGICQGPSGSCLRTARGSGSRCRVVTGKTGVWMA